MYLSEAQFSRPASPFRITKQRPAMLQQLLRVPVYTDHGPPPTNIDLSGTIQAQPRGSHLLRDRFSGWVVGKGVGSGMG